MPDCGFVFRSKHMQENVTVVTQQMQHLCLTAEARPAPLSDLFNLWVARWQTFMISFRSERG